MSNKEYFSDFWENKSAPEFKEFKAELYEKKNEFFSGVGEIKSFDFESFDHTPVENKIDEVKKKEKRARAESEKKKTRTRLQKILDNVSKTATKVASTVVGVAAVGVGAVVALSPLFSPSVPEPSPISVSLVDLDVGGNFLSYEIDVSGLQKDTDYDILVSSNNKTIAYDEVINGTNKEFVVGLNPNEKYTLSVVEKSSDESFVHYEKEFTTNDTEIIKESFQATLEIPDINSVTVEWHDDKNTISLPATFSPATDENYRYRVSLTDQSGNVLSSYTGSDGSISLDAPLDAKEVTVTYETLYDTGKHEVIYSTEKLSETLLLEAPKILLSDEKTLIDIGYYAIEYGITTRLDEFEIYENFSVVINGVDHSPIFSPSVINGKDAIFLEFSDPVDEFDLEATLTMRGAYGGNPRTVTLKKHYVNELEFYDEVYYSKLYDTVEFELLHSKVGGYVLIKDLLLGTEEQITSASHSYPFTGDHKYSYALYDKEGKMISEEKTVSFAPFSAPEYTFNYCNPGEVIYTLNEDGTLNFYFETNFSSSDPNAYYEITLSSSVKSYTFRSTEALLKVEDLPNDEYGLNFKIFTTDASGTAYEFYNVTPSGTTGIYPESYISYNFIDDKTLKLSFGSDLALDGDIYLTLNGREYVFSKDELVLDGYNNILTVTSDDERIDSFELTVYTYVRSINDELYQKYAKEIKGTPYVKIIITY